MGSNPTRSAHIERLRLQALFQFIKISIQEILSAPFVSLYHCGDTATNESNQFSGMNAAADLGVAKESIFSGMNNLKVNTVLDDRYSSYFGFSKDEVAQMLDYYGQKDKLAKVCDWYDGYHRNNAPVEAL